jgi:hypothetical protein
LQQIIRFTNSIDNVQEENLQNIKKLKNSLDNLLPSELPQVKSFFLKILNTIQYRLNEDGKISGAHRDGIIDKLGRLENFLVYTKQDISNLYDTFIYYAQHHSHTWFKNQRINFLNNISRTKSIGNILTYIGIPLHERTNELYIGIELEKKKIDNVIANEMTPANIDILIEKN